MNAVFVYNKPNIIDLFDKKQTFFLFTITPIPFNTLNNFSMLSKLSESVLPLIKISSTLTAVYGIKRIFN